jgi:single-strand DNA-binding protein
MYQQITIIGNCGRDPEMRYTNEGIGVCNFSVAVNKRRKNANTGEYTDVTTWFKVSAWRNLAETCSQLLQKCNSSEQFRKRGLDEWRKFQLCTVQS